MIAYTLAGLWVAGCLLCFAYTLAEAWGEHPGFGALVFALGAPLFFMLGWLPWHMLDEETGPSFALQKAQWTCTASHAESTSVVIGKVAANSLSTVCDQWSRK